MNTDIKEESLSLANKNRNRIIIRTSIIGIVSNVILASFKAVIGLIVGSVAIVMDSVNNFSDAASSIITIVGTKLAGKKPDRKHPFGHGRAEYLSAMIISLIVLYAGITAFIESVKKIITPEEPDYSIASLIIIGVAIIAKFVLGRYVQSVGKKVNSDSLVNSGKDALLDAIISASTLAAAGVYLAFRISLEAWLGAAISLVIVKSGIDMLRETLSKILGERTDPDLARDLKEAITSYPEVSGAYDLIVHNYGPDSYTASVHIEVQNTMKIAELDLLSRRITQDIYSEFGVILTAIGIYSVESDNEEVNTIKDHVYELVNEEKDVLQVHGFNIDFDEKTMRFDVIISFDSKDRNEVYQRICANVQKEFPEYNIYVTLDSDFSEEIE